MFGYCSCSHSLGPVHSHFFLYLSNLHNLTRCFCYRKYKALVKRPLVTVTAADATPSPPHWHLLQQCVRLCACVTYECACVFVTTACTCVSEWMRACPYYMLVCVFVFSINNSFFLLFSHPIWCVFSYWLHQIYIIKMRIFLTFSISFSYSLVPCSTGISTHLNTLIIHFSRDI